MKRLIFPILLLFCFGACSSDSELDDLKKSIKEQEEINERLRKEQEEKKKEEERLKEENERKRKEAEEREKELNKPALLSWEFLTVDNPMQLVTDAKCEILDDNTIECWVTNIMNDRLLVPRFEFKGESLMIDGKQAESGTKAFDFRKPVTLTVNNKGQSVSYTVYVHSYTGLPVVWLETEKHELIRELNWNYPASFKLVEDVKTRAPGDVIEQQIKVKAVAPINYYISPVYDSPQLAKNGYIMTFENYISLLGEPENNDWELYPNITDLSMIRRQTGLHLGKMSNLSYTPGYHFVEFMLNGRYYGTYMLGDVLENSSSRVNVGLDGYILKIDSATTSLHFKQKTIEQPISVLAPVTKSGDSEYLYLRNLMNEIEEVLFSASFTSTVGWQKYLDMDSFVDWYLINEIARNEDAVFQANCYMYFKKGEKVKMGPLWKFDKGFGMGSSTSTEGFVVNKSMWYDRLFQDPVFVDKVKERYTYFYSHKNDILAEMSADADYLKYSAVENNNKWRGFKVYGQSASPLYQNEIQSLKTWLENRMEWLNKAISSL